MVPRLRFPDWIGLVGLTLLLAWTPGYIAQDPSERELTGGETFTLPHARIGDRAVLDLLYTGPDGKTERYPGLIELRIEEVDPDDPLTDAVGASYRLVKHFEEAEIDLDNLRYRSNDTTYEIWYRSNGAIAWYHFAGHQPYSNTADGEDVVAPVYGRGPSLCDDVGVLNEFPSATIRYAPDAMEVYWRSLREGFVFGDERACGLKGTPDQPIIVNRAFAFGDQMLFGQHHIALDRVVGELGQGRGTPYRTCTFDQGRSVYPPSLSDLFSLGPHERDYTLNQRLQFAKQVETLCDYRNHFETWAWIHPDFPAPAGVHSRHTSPDGSLLFQVDLVPALIERGKGPIVSTFSRPTWSQYEPVAQARVNHTVLQVTRLDELEGDATPLLHGHSLKAVAGRLRADPPETMANFLNSGARLVAWSVYTDYAPEPNADRPSYWTLTFVGSGDRLRTAVVTLTWDLPATGRSTNGDGPEETIRSLATPPENVSDGPRSWSMGAADMCNKKSRQEWEGKYCGLADAARADPARLLAAPAAYRDHLAALTTGPHGNIWEPGAGTTIRVDQRTLDPRGVTTVGQVDQVLLVGAVEWRLDSYRDQSSTRYETSGSLNLKTGGVYEFSRSASASDAPEAWQKPRTWTATAATTTLEPVTPQSTTLAWSGLLLLLGAAALRALGAAKSGAIPAFAAGLYAKIRKEDVLDHGRREAIVDIVGAEPGITTKELATRIEAGWGATVHHIDRLRQSGIVTRVTVGRNRHVFLAEGTDPATRRLAALRRDPDYRAFLECVEATPGISMGEVAKQVEQGPSGVSRTGSRLAKAGLIEKRRDGRQTRFYLAAASAT